MKTFNEVNPYKPTELSTKSSRYLLAALVFFLLPTMAFAGTSEGLSDVFKNLTKLGTTGTTMVTALSYFIGACLAAYGIANIKALGNARSEPGKGMAVVAALIAGAGLIYLPTVIQVSGNTVFSSTSSDGAGGGTSIDR